MPMYSEELQQLTDQLVAEVTNLYNLVSTDPPDMQAIADVTTSIHSTASSIDTAIKSSDVPAAGTMPLNLTTQLLLEVGSLQSAIGANDFPAVQSATGNVVETTMNLNRTVKRMAESQGTGIAGANLPPTPPWFLIPSVPTAPPEGTK